jgi:ABC-type nitrate/sulfonate/bicarbonate transport system permease component
VNALARSSLWTAASIGVGILLVYLWQLVADSGVVAPVFLPGPDAVYAAFSYGVESAGLGGMFLATAERMVFAWFLSAMAGIAIGAVLGLSPTARAYVEPSLELLRPLPASAVIPVAIAIFGLGEVTVYAVICFGALWPMLLATLNGFANVPSSLYEFARTIRMSRTAVVLKIALPGSLPDILGGLRVSLAIALILTVVAEMLTGEQGLGTWIQLAGRSYRAAEVFAGIALLGLLGYISSLLMYLVERYFLRWRDLRR